MISRRGRLVGVSFCPLVPPNAANIAHPPRRLTAPPPARTLRLVLPSCYALCYIPVTPCVTIQLRLVLQTCYALCYNSVTPCVTIQLRLVLQTSYALCYNLVTPCVTILFSFTLFPYHMAVTPIIPLTISHERETTFIDFLLFLVV